MHSISKDTWMKLTFSQQMANIGAEVGRALKWKSKNKKVLQDKAFFRALDLLQLTMAVHHSGSVLKELCRVKEQLIDHVMFDNQWQSTEDSWNQYFYHFNKVARS